MADNASTASTASTTPAKATGKTINFNLVGDDLHLYETIRDIYQEEAEEDEAAVQDALEGLDPEVRALVQAKFAPKPVRKELSHRQVFVRALREVLAAKDAAEDEATAPNAANGAATEE